MKITPLIFNGDMVRALKDGRKTQTRRIAKLNEAGRFKLGGKQWHPDDPNAYLASPWQVGDLIYVRETWSDVSNFGSPAIAYRADSDIRDLMFERSFLEDGAFNYDDPRCAKYSFENWADDLFSGVEGHWQPSIHMPRWVSRLTLKVTGVRVERVQDISEQDAESEGIKCTPFYSRDGHHLCDSYTHLDEPHHLSSSPSAISAFGILWKQIYGKSREPKHIHKRRSKGKTVDLYDAKHGIKKYNYDWNSNPLVWVIEFEVIHQNVDEYLKEAAA